MNTLSPARLSSPTFAAASQPAFAAGGFLVFFAVLGPMSTVPALRRLIIDGHHGSPALLHAFVAAGMVGSVLAAPFLGARADARGNHLSLAAKLAFLDAFVALATSSALPTALLFVLRPLHGAASMGILALLFASFRGSRRELVSHAGAAAIGALAFGPALGGVLTRLGPGAPFRFAAALSLLLSIALFLHAGIKSASTVSAPTPRAPRPISGAARELWAPLSLVATQRFAIGGLVATFALHVRSAHGFSDAKVGMGFSSLLLAFALCTFLLGRSLRVARMTRLIAPGAVLFGVALAGLCYVPAKLLMPTLAVAGVGAALVYAPCLALTAVGNRPRATSMGLLHAAGGVGMALGPVGALLVELCLRDAPLQVRTATFMLLGGALQALAALWLAPKLLQAANASAAAENIHGS